MFLFPLNLFGLLFPAVCQILFSSNSNYLQLIYIINVYNLPRFFVRSSVSYNVICYMRERIFMVQYLGRVHLQLQHFCRCFVFQRIHTWFNGIFNFLIYSAISLRSGVISSILRPCRHTFFCTYLRRIHNFFYYIRCTCTCLHRTWWQVQAKHGACSPRRYLFTLPLHRPFVSALKSE